MATNLIGATAPELAVYGALVKLREPFTFQSQLLGQYGEKGSTIADFLLTRHSIIISVIGWYWHTARPETATKDQLQRQALTSQGYRVIYIDEEDALKDATFYTTEAIRGIDHSRYQYLVQ